MHRFVYDDQCSNLFFFDNNISTPTTTTLLSMSLCHITHTVSTEHLSHILHIFVLCTTTTTTTTATTTTTTTAAATDLCNTLFIPHNQIVHRLNIYYIHPPPEYIIFIHRRVRVCV